MPKIKKSDLNYNDYSWTAIEGDDPEKVFLDSGRFSRHEGYEVIYLLNNLTAAGGKDLPIKSRLICEWMIKKKLPSDIQGRAKVVKWIADNFSTLEKNYPF